jgi:hypothetical protein
MIILKVNAVNAYVDNSNPLGIVNTESRDKDWCMGSNGIDVIGGIMPKS